MSFILPVIVGLALLLVGRRIFWFVLAVIGFYIGMKLAPLFIEEPGQNVMLIISIGCGVVAAILAILVQKVAIGLSGFLLGAYGAFLAMHRFGVDLGNLNWLPLLGIGILGTILATKIFEWGLIVISSFAGAYLLVETIDLGESTQSMLFVALTIVGIIVQAKDMEKGTQRGKSEKGKKGEGSKADSSGEVGH